MKTRTIFGPQFPTYPTLSMRGIRFANEGGTGDGAGAGEGAGENGAGGTGTGEPAPKPGEGQNGEGKQGETLEQTVARLQSDIARLEREKTDVRVAKEGEIKKEAKRTEMIALARVMGVDGVQDNDTLESVTEKITGKTLSKSDTPDATAAQKAQALQTATVTEAWKLGVSPERADYLAFKLGQNPEYKNLDTESSDFATKLQTIIKTVVASDTAFGQSSGGAGSSGGGNHGGSGGNQQITQEAFNSMSIDEKSKLFDTNRSEFDRLISGI